MIAERNAARDSYPSFMIQEKNVNVNKWCYSSLNGHIWHCCFKEWGIRGQVQGVEHGCWLRRSSLHICFVKHNMHSTNANMLYGCIRVNGAHHTTAWLQFCNGRAMKLHTVIRSCWTIASNSAGLRRVGLLDQEVLDYSIKLCWTETCWTTGLGAACWTIG